MHQTSSHCNLDCYGQLKILTVYFVPVDRRVLLGNFFLSWDERRLRRGDCVYVSLSIKYGDTWRYVSHLLQPLSVSLCPPPCTAPQHSTDNICKIYLLVYSSWLWLARELRMGAISISIKLMRLISLESPISISVSPHSCETLFIRHKVCMSCRYMKWFSKYLIIDNLIWRFRINLPLNKIMIIIPFESLHFWILNIRK